MPLTNIDHYAIRTCKLEETKAFYEVLGLVDGKRPNFPFKGHWLYLGEVALVHLISDDPNKPGGLEEYLGEAEGGTKNLSGSGSVDHLAFRATDASALKKRLEKQNIAFTEREVPNMRLFQIFAKDPNNIMIEINYYQ
jgi:catechol 2,3-dioxygenase-like lactoylglutathione lyase family enzyme